MVKWGDVHPAIPCGQFLCLYVGFIPDLEGSRGPTETAVEAPPPVFYRSPEGDHTSQDEDGNLRMGQRIPRVSLILKGTGMLCGHRAVTAQGVQSQCTSGLVTWNPLQAYRRGLHQPHRSAGSLMKAFVP